ncbi:hypothetical protein V6N13_113827 [Hibiscus sabdariffa]|uniref:FAF domain-containing protein n=1 Tax=Hibiscus sabdariffa TaxID=183260 RepID=A0ABR2U0N2_9ROSI
MSGPFSKSPRLCSALMDTDKPGIGSILGPAETPTTTVAAASLRRTLSADMSSKKWLAQQGLSESPLKKVASSLQFPPSSIIDSSSEEGEEDLWNSIQRENKKNRLEKPGQFDIWSSIISQKAEDESSKSVPVPYIHPLVKRSASSLSEKSLEICTESLGSETGSDGFSSYPPSESGDMQEDDPIERDPQLQHQKQERDTCFDHGVEPRIFKYYSYDVGKKSTDQHRSFPPPITSLSRKDGASVRIKTHRDNGRLVLEAVSMPSQNNFVAQRQNGRLVLTFSNSTEEDEVGELEEEYESFREEEKESEAIGAMSVHRLAVMMNKPICLANRNPTWPKHFGDMVKLGEEKGDKVEPTTISPSLGQSLPPLPPRVSGRLITSSPPSMAAATSFNAYEYYWRRPNQSMAKAKNYQQQWLVMVPLSKGCKEPRRSLLFWEPHCIAT